MRNEIANFKDCKSIAIMGGTFDPIHNGHLVTAEAVRHRFKVDRVVFIPTGRPAHKLNKKVTHNEHRYLMTVLATMRNENFEVSRIEIDRPGATYTIDTIEELKKQGVWIFGTAAEGSIPMYKADLTGGTAIVIGNEGDGMSRLVRKNCDLLVHIPMQGRISSLNASAAAAILLYEAVRQRLN